jgi:hypothetical protein
MEATTPRAYRQGDVLIRAIAGIPATAKKLRRAELAYGEVTGHSHRIEDLTAAELREDGDGLYMTVSAGGGVTIRHEEHAAQVIPPGNYEIVQQVEDTEWGEQAVID